MSTPLTTAQHAAIVYQLQQIKESNGYNNTIHEVFDSEYNEFDLTNFPCAIITNDEDRILNSQAQMNPQGHLIKHHDFIFDVYSNDMNNLSDAQDAITADVEKRFLADNVRNWLPGSTGAKTCTEIMFFDAHKAWQVREGLKVKPKFTCGVRFSIRCYYGQSITDPYTLM
jgi:hypothetical protein